MTYKEAYEKHTDWYKKVFIISLYHNKMLLKNKKWNIRRTSHAMRLSLGTISEAITLAAALTEFPELKACLTKKDALHIVRHMEKKHESV